MKRPINVSLMSNIYGAVLISAAFSLLHLIFQLLHLEKFIIMAL
jgi:hypothetical protein